MQQRINKKYRGRFYNAIAGKSGLLFSLLALFIVFGVLTGGRFLSIANLINLLRAISLSAIVAFGMTLCITIGGIDLSVGALMAVSSTYTAGMIEHNVPVSVALLGGISMSLVLGMITGLLISRTTIPPFIATLAMMTVARGVAYLYSGGRPIRTPIDFGSIGNGYLFNIIPYPIIFAFVIMILMVILLNRTKFGRSIYAIGGNREAALFSGINIRTVIWATYALSGLLCGIAGVLWASRTYSGQPTLGTGAEMQAIAAVVVGGTSMSGGIGTIGGTLIGALIIQTLNSGLNYLNVPFYYQNILQGAVIVMAVFMDVRSKNDKKLASIRIHELLRRCWKNV